MVSYQEAEALFAKRRGNQKKVGNNTVLHRIDADTLAVRLHQTDVVLLHRDGSYTLNSGGWRTATTKERMKEWSGAWLYQEKGVWYINGQEFEDGMKV